MSSVALHQTAVEGFGKGGRMERRINLHDKNDSWVVVEHNHTTTGAYSYEARLYRLTEAHAVVPGYVAGRPRYVRIRAPRVCIYNEGMLTSDGRWGGYGRADSHIHLLYIPQGGERRQLRLVFRDEREGLATKDIGAHVWGPQFLAYGREPLARDLLDVCKQPVLWDPESGVYTMPLEWLLGELPDPHTAAVNRRLGKLGLLDFHTEEAFRDWAIARLEEANA